MEIKVATLNYDKKALEPTISSSTIDYHYGKHYQAYVDNYNKLVAEHPNYHDFSLIEVIQNSEGALYNNAAQSLNHEMYFSQFTDKSTTPKGVLLDAINYKFNSFEEMVELLTQKSIALFGSGWVWLALNGRNLVIMEGSNAFNPIVEGVVPLLAIDVWEHAYYLDYENKRAEYIKRFWDILDWDIIEKRYVEAIEKSVNFITDSQAVM